MRGGKKRFRMTFDENVPNSTFDLIAGQDIASGAQSDKAFADSVRAAGNVIALAQLEAADVGAIYTHPLSVIRTFGIWPDAHMSRTIFSILRRPDGPGPAQPRSHN